MSRNRPYRLNRQTLAADRAALVAMQELNSFTPVNPAHRIETLTALGHRLEQARQNEILTKNALAAIRDEIVATEWALHDALLGVKAQVVAQYGPDSDPVQALGLKKKSKWRRTVTRPQTEPSPPVSADIS